MKSEFPITQKTKITRLPKRGSYDQKTIYAILDEALFCTVAFVFDGEPFQIPTGFCRIKDNLYIHGSVGSSYMRKLAQGDLSVCISATLLDGIVLARSAFHQSMNYRSVVLFSKATEVTDNNELENIFEIFTNKMCPGRWADVRKPTSKEWEKTMTLCFPISEASAKIREGNAKDDEEDYNLNTWAGVQPLQIVRMPPISDPNLKVNTKIPDYLSQ